MPGMAAFQSLSHRMIGASVRAFSSTGFKLAHQAARRSGRRPSLATSASRYQGGGGRGRGPPRQADGFDSIGEEMKFEFTAGDEEEVTLFSDKRVSPEVVAALASHNITSFTPIQRETFDPLYDGRDMIGRSRTGTGKTLAFGLPICEVVAKAQAERGMMGKRGRKPVVIILAPTRELAKQCEDQLSRVGKPLGLWIRTIYGGVSYDRQMRDLESGFDILVGTPGRIMDHLDRGTLSLEEIRHVILDEADEMLKMGFAEDIEKIFSYFSVEETQVLLFSATTPSWVLEIARRYLKNPINVDAVGATGSRGATTIRHLAVKVPDNYMARKNILEDVIAAHSNGGKVIVFTQTKAEADELSTSSSFAAENTRVLHGDITQRQREITLKQFRDNFFKVLIATDVAARGIDISEVDLVVQYKPPEDTDTYIHRSGRTGRAGRLGTSVVMYSESEWFKLGRLEKSIQIKFEKLGMPSIRDVVAGLCAGQMEKIKGVDEQVIPYFEAFATEMLEQGGLTPQEALARCMVAMTGRQLTVHRSVLTGQTGMTTIIAEAKDPFREYDLFEHVKTLYDGEERIHIPQVAFLWNKPNAAVFDLDAAKAKLILAKSENDPTFRMSVCEEMPRLDAVPFRGGGRGNDRGGSFQRGGNSRGGNSYGGGKSYGGGGGYERRDRGSYNGGGNSWSKGGGASRDGGRRSFDDYGGGSKFGGDKFGGDKFGGDKFGGDKFGGDKFSDRPRSSSPRPRSPAGAGAGPKKDESLDKFLSSLDWP